MYRKIVIAVLAGCLHEPSVHDDDIDPPTDDDAPTCTSVDLIGASPPSTPWALVPTLLAQPPALSAYPDDTAALPYPWTSATGPVFVSQEDGARPSTLMYVALSGPPDAGATVRSELVLATVRGVATPIANASVSGRAVVHAAGEVWALGDGSFGYFQAVRLRGASAGEVVVLCEPGAGRMTLPWPFVRSDGRLGVIAPGRVCVGGDERWTATAIPEETLGILVPPMAGAPRSAWFTGAHWYDAESGEVIVGPDLPTVESDPDRPVLQAMVLDSPPRYLAIRSQSIEEVGADGRHRWNHQAHGMFSAGGCAGDLDGDGRAELIVPTSDSSDSALVALSVSGAELWRTAATDASEGLSCSVADLDADGRLEVLWQDNAGLHIVDFEGRVLFVGPETAGLSTFDPPVVVDVDADGSSDVVVAAASFMVHGMPYGDLEGPVAWSSPTASFGLHRSSWLGSYDHGVNVGADDQLEATPATWWDSAAHNGEHLMPLDTAPCRRIQVVEVTHCVEEGRLHLTIQNVGQGIAPGTTLVVNLRTESAEVSAEVPLLQGLAPGGMTSAAIAWAGETGSAAIRAWDVADSATCIASAREVATPADIE